MTELTDEAVKTLAAARPGNLFVDQDEDVCIDDGRKFNLIFCPARDDVELEGDWPVLNPEVVAEIVARYNIAPDLARALLDARAERDRLRADAQADDVSLIRTIHERDAAQEWADKLAHAIGGDAVGEHSNMNNPWANALELAARLRADAQAANGVWQANLRLQAELARVKDALHTALLENVDNVARLTAELAAAQQREAKLREAGARLLGHATQDMSEQMDAWDAFEAALSNNGRGE